MKELAGFFRGLALIFGIASLAIMLDFGIYLITGWGVLAWITKKYQSK